MTSKCLQAMWVSFLVYICAGNDIRTATCVSVQEHCIPWKPCKFIAEISFFKFLSHHLSGVPYKPLYGIESELAS